MKLAQDSDPLEGLRNVLISAPNGERIPISQLAELSQTDGFAWILLDGNVRRIAIKWSVRERDMGGLVAEAMRKINAAVKLPDGLERSV